MSKSVVLFDRTVKKIKNIKKNKSSRNNMKVNLKKILTYGDY